MSTEEPSHVIADSKSGKRYLDQLKRIRDAYSWCIDEAVETVKRAVNMRKKLTGCLTRLKRLLEEAEDMLKRVKGK